MINKNYNRVEQPDFANINLLGKCNADCFFCLGKDIEDLLSRHNQTKVHFDKWKNFNKFLKLCKDKGIKKLYLTGQNVDSLQYMYLKELIYFLSYNYNFKFGLRTNGYLAKGKMDLIKMCDDEIGISIHSLNPNTNYKIMGKSTIPLWEEVLPQIPNLRISIVINRYNAKEFFDLIKFLSKFENIKYIQVRRISTETRYDLLKEDIEIYEELFNEIQMMYKQTGEFYLAQQFNIFGKEVDFWRTVETSINSINYFTDGTISEDYFIVDGYLKNYKQAGEKNG